MRKISNCELATRVLNCLNVTNLDVCFDDVLADIDAGRTPTEESQLVSDAWISDTVANIVRGWNEAMESDTILDKINGRI